MPRSLYQVSCIVLLWDQTHAAVSVPKELMFCVGWPPYKCQNRGLRCGELISVNHFNCDWV